MTEKVPSLTPSQKKEQKSTAKMSEEPRQPTAPKEFFESQGILATTLSQLAEDLKISMLALKDTQIRAGDSFAIEGQVNASGVFESTIVQYRRNAVLNRKLLLPEYDYRGNEWVPTKDLQIKLVRPNSMTDFAWNDKFSVRGPNLAEFQAEVKRIASKITTHCQTREGLVELSAQCKVQGEYGVNTISVAKNKLQEIIFPSFWNQTNIDWINRLATLIDLPPSEFKKPNIEAARAVIIAFMQDGIDRTVSIQALEKSIKEGLEAYQNKSKPKSENKKSEKTMITLN